MFTFIATKSTILDGAYINNSVAFWGICGRKGEGNNPHENNSRILISKDVSVFISSYNVIKMYYCL